MYTTYKRDPVAAQHGVTFALDVSEAIPVGFGTYIVKGWCFTQNSSDELAVFLLADGVQIPAVIGLPRPDVSNALDNPAAGECGFVARFKPSLTVKSVALLATVNGTTFPLAETVLLPAHSNVASYEDWIRIREPELFWPEDEIQSQLAKLARKPMISIVLASRGTQPYFLKRCIESVLGQAYENWQLCTTNLYPAQADTRIQPNAAPSGDFIVFLNDSDELHPCALLELVRAISVSPEHQFFYSDEDELDGGGVRSHPLFKPDFDENIFLSFNYLGRMVALRRDLLSGLEGFRGWDLLLRVCEKLDMVGITHLRKPLYHRRSGLDTDAKVDAVRIVQAHVTRTAKDATVEEGLFYGSARVKYRAPKQLEIGVLFRSEDGPFQSAVVTGTAGNRRLHLSRLEGDLLVFINGPLESLNHLFFEELAAQGMRQDCGLVTGICLDTEGRVIASGFQRSPDNRLIDSNVGAKFPSHGYMKQLSVVRSIDACPELFFAVRREYLPEATDTLAATLGENAVKNGLSILFTPYAIATFSGSCQPLAAPDSYPFRMEKAAVVIQEQVPIDLEPAVTSRPRRFVNPLRAVAHLLRGGGAS